MPAGVGVRVAPDVPALWDGLASEIAAGRRFAGLFGTARPGGLLLSAHLAGPGGIGTWETLLPSAAAGYPPLTPDDVPRPRPGIAGGPAVIEPDPRALPLHVIGPGMFTIPHGPVRSGVVESVGYLVETPGEDIPHLNIRMFYKHRGIEKRFEGMTPGDGVLLAERVEGTAAVAHALAFCHALERISGVAVAWPAALVRTLHAELERLACHLDVAVRLADAAGLAVATARFGWHKEQVLRMVSRLCGSRFGRGVVVPGGVSSLPQITPGELLAGVSRLEKAVTADVRTLMGTASFLDRL